MSVNKAIIVGNVTKDPDVRQAGSSTVANFSVATNESWTDKSGEKKERAEFHRIVVWGKLADICGKYVHKGSQVYLEGRLQTREWEKDGKKNYTTEIQADTVQFLGSKQTALSSDNPFGE